MRSPAFLLTFALLLLSQNACSNPYQPSSTAAVSVQGVKVTPQTMQLAAIGDTGRLSATISPANATDQVLIWESTDTTVAVVNAAGLVTAKGVGSGVFVTAYTHDGHYQSSANVSVSP